MGKFLKSILIAGAAMQPSSAAYQRPERPQVARVQTSDEPVSSVSATAVNDWPEPEVKLTGEQLIKKLDHLGDAKSPFQVFHDVSILEECAKETPKTRTESGVRHEDKGLIKGMQYAMDQGYLNKNTLVITNTGHGLPTAAFMAKHFGSDVYMHAPKKSFDRDLILRANVDRNAGQAQSFTSTIEGLRSQTQRQGVSTVLAYDLHANKDLAADIVSKLPDAKQLHDMGFTSVIILEETSPNKSGAQAYKKGKHYNVEGLIGPFMYLDKIAETNEQLPKSDQLTVRRFGIDTRFMSHCVDENKENSKSR